MQPTEIEKYLTEKHRFFQKILEITREQENIIPENNLDRFNLYLAETSKIISNIEKLDQRFQGILEAWNVGQVRVPKDLAEKVDLLNRKIQKTMEEIRKLQPAQLEHFVEEKKLLEKDLLNLRRDRKIFGTYEKVQDTARILDIKK